MSPSRAAVVGMLVAAEVAVAGFAVWTATRPGWLPAALHISTAAAAAPMKTFTPIAAGPSPVVLVDDPDSHVTVALSHDGAVHVRDLTNLSNSLFGGRRVPQLAVSRTADGVSVIRRAYDDWRMHIDFGFNRQAIEVDVPAGAHLQVKNCSGADVTGVMGGVAVHSQDGHIALTDGGGTVDLQTQDGHVAAINVRGDAISLGSQDGHIEARDLVTNRLKVETQDGHVTASDITVAGASPQATLASQDGSMHVSGRFAPGGTYAVSTDDGGIDLALAPGADLTIDAASQDGHVTVDGNSYGDSQSDHTVRLGKGSGTMRVHTQDGSITITTNESAVTR